MNIPTRLEEEGIKRENEYLRGHLENINKVPEYPYFNLEGEVVERRNGFTLNEPDIDNIFLDTLYLSDSIYGRAHLVEYEPWRTKLPELEALYQDEIEKVYRESDTPVFRDLTTPKDFLDIVECAITEEIPVYYSDSAERLINGDSKYHQSALKWVKESLTALEDPGKFEDIVKDTVWSAQSLEGETLFITSREFPMHIIDNNLKSEDITDTLPHIAKNWFKNSQSMTYSKD